MDAGQPVSITFSVKFHVEAVGLLEANHHVVDIFHTFCSLSHSLGGVVGVASRTIPIREEFGLEADGKVVSLANSTKQVSGHPEVISNLNTKAGSDLVLPLTRHDFSIGSGYLDTGVKTGFVVCISYISTKANITSNRAIEGTLVSGVTSTRPSVGSQLELVLLLQESVLLLDTIPRFFGGTLVENFLGKRSKIGVVWDQIFESCILPHVALAKNENVVAASEWIGEESDGFDDDL